MKKKNTIILLSSIAGIFCVVIVLSLLAPAFITQEIITKKIVQELSQKLDAEVQVKRSGLSIFPRPRVAAYELTVIFSDRATLNIAEAQLYPALLPLLNGTVQPAHIHVIAPHLSFSMPSYQTAPPALGHDVTIAGIQKRAAESIRKVLHTAPLSSVVVSGGDIQITAGENTLFSFSGVRGQLQCATDRASVTIRCGSNMWKKAALQAAVLFSDMQLDGTVSFSELDLHPILKYVSPDAFSIVKSVIDGEGSIVVDTSGLIGARFKVAVPSLSVNKQGEQQIIKGALQSVGLKTDLQNTFVAVAGIFEYPLLNVSGTCSIETAQRTIRFEGEGKNIDLGSCAEVAGSFFRQQPQFREIAGRIKGGTFSDVSFKAQGPLGLDIVGNKNFVLRGRLSRGHLVITEANSEVEDLSADVTAQNGILVAQNIHARCGQSRIDNGSVQIDLSRQYKPLLIDTEFTADVSQLPRFLHLIPESIVRRELSLIQNPQGTGSGRFTMRAMRDSHFIDIDLTGLRLEARYRSFPMPLKLSKGQCAYQNGILSFSDVSGILGKSMVQHTAASFNLGNAPALSIATNDATVDLEELRMALNSFPATHRIIRDITRLTGQLTIRSLAINGPLRSPQQWKFMLRGEVRDAQLAATQLESAATIKNATLQINQDVFSMIGAHAEYLDSSLKGTLYLKDYLQGITSLKLTARGSVGQKSVLQIMDLINAPAELVPHGPLLFKQSQLIWTRNGLTEFNGDFSCARGPQIVVSMQAQPQTLEIKKLQITDQASEILISLGMQKDFFDFTFKGHIEKATVDRVLLNNQLMNGWINGDMTARLNWSNPLHSTATGTLAWEDIQHPRIDTFPLNIKSASLTAQGKKLTIKNAQVTAGSSTGTAEGSIVFEREGYILDLQLAANRLNLDEFHIMATRNSSDGGEKNLWEIPVRGTVLLTAQSLSLGPLAWRPFHATITVADRKITVAAIDSKLCSIETPGTIVVAPGGMHISAQPAVQNASAREIIQCVTGKRAVISGRINLQGDFVAHGSADDVMNTLRGNLSIVARKGRIYRSNLFTNILSFLSVRNLILGRKADIAEKGFAYRSLSINGEFHGNTFKIHEGVLDSNTLSLACEGTYNLSNKRMDLTVLATPFQIYDLVLMSVPVVGMVFGRTLIGVPIRVTGALDDPKLGPGNPAAIPRGILGIFKNIVKLPVRIIEPIMPQKDSENRR
jgi:hypothetical protein